MARFECPLDRILVKVLTSHGSVNLTHKLQGDVLREDWRDLCRRDCRRVQRTAGDCELFLQLKLPILAREWTRETLAASGSASCNRR